jgi:hypothetical protein
MTSGPDEPHVIDRVSGHEPRRPQKPSEARNRRILLFAGSAIVLVTVLGLVVVLLVGRGFTATGTFTLLDRDGDGVGGEAEYGEIGKGAPCFGTGGYDDIREGAPVLIRDDAGTTVGEGRLEYARTIGRLSCVFTFTIEDVASGAEFYEVEVSGRGGTNFTQDELEKGIGLAIGGEW